MNTENNKIIAEFIGFTQVYPNLKNYDKPNSPAHLLRYKPNEENSVFNKTLHRGSNPLCVKNDFHPKDMYFNQSWDWLMPVVEKIETIKFKLPLQEYGQYKAMKIKDALTMGYNGLTKIEVVYNTCVEFIKWYNENNLK